MADRLRPWERIGLCFFALIIVLFGVLTTYRAAFLQRRMGDANMLFRAGWFARIGGEQLYTMKSDNNLHYHYPPIVAYLVAPLADPPAGEDRTGCLPFWVSVAIWYAFNAGLILLGMHLLASTLEASTGPAPPTGSRTWWMLRIVPLLVCLPCVGSTLNQGQITPLIFFFFVLVLALQGSRRILYGMCIAAAACIKIFPALLAVGPLWRRDGRAVVGIGIGLILGLGILPTLAYGPTRTLELYQQLNHVLIGPALGWGSNTTRGDELLDANGPKSQSLVAAVNNWVYPDRATRPDAASPIAGILHKVISLGLLLGTLVAFRRPRTPLSAGAEAGRETLFAATLILVMLLICPVVHLHYYMLTLPAVVVLVALCRDGQAQADRSLVAVLGIHMLTVILSQLPGLEILKDRCLPTYGVILLWFFAVRLGYRMGQGTATAATPPVQLEPRQAA